MRHAILIAFVSFLTGASLVALATYLACDGRVDTRSITTPPASEESVPAPDRNETTTYRDVTPTSSATERVEVELTGYQDRWRIRYRGPAGRFDRSADAGDAVLRLPADSAVRLTLKSRDYVYMLSLPHINKSQVAVPDLEFRLEFRTRSPGVFFLRGDHACGPTRPQLTVAVRVEPRAEFQTWLDELHGGNDP